MKYLKITAHVTVTDDTPSEVIKQRVQEQLNKLSNPKREDQGITTVNHVFVMKDPE